MMLTTRNIRFFVGLILLCASSMATAATTLVRFEYLGDLYNDFLNESPPSGEYGIGQQLRGEFYIDEAELDSGRTFFGTTTIGGNALEADIFGLRLFDARVDLDGLSNILNNGDFVQIIGGEVTAWELQLTTRTQISALLQDEQWKTIGTASASGGLPQVDGSQIIQCIQNCSLNKTFNEVYGTDRGRAVYALAASNAGATGSWTRDETLYTLNAGGDIVPVPVPAAAWLFLSAIGALGLRRNSAA